jgi:excisionase family DNA binding protein
LTVREVAAELGVCTATVYRLFDRGELPHVRILDSIRVAHHDLRQFIEARRKNAGHA